MKTLIIFVFFIISIIPIRAQGIDFQTLKMLSAKKEWSAINDILTSKGWSYHSAKKGDEKNYSRITWIYNKNNIIDYFFLYLDTENTYFSKVEYYTENQLTYKKIIKDIESEKFFKGKENIDDEGSIECTYDNFKTHRISVSVLSAKLSDTNRPSYSVVVEKLKELSPTSLGVTKTIIVNGHKAVDLGLPSGTLWATANVEANSITSYGAFFSWGEIESKLDYSEEQYNFSEASKCFFLGPQNDVASKKWGNAWSMPSKDNFQELIDFCKWIWSPKANGTDTYGYKVIGPNGNFIFLPAAGYIFRNLISGSNTTGCYWTNENSNEKPYSLYFNHFESNDSRYSNSDEVFVSNTLLGSREKYWGLLVRPVVKR